MSDLISRQAAIDALDEIRYALWEIDIPSPTVPEYVEHHEQVQSVMKLLDKKRKEFYDLPPVQPEQKDFEKQLHAMFDHIWDCEIDHPVFQDTVGELMEAVIQAHKNSAQPESCEDTVFWRKRAEDYENQCIKLVAEITRNSMQWIPCSERLPTKQGRYLVTQKIPYGMRVTTTFFDGDEFWNGAIAWMPRPEPYKENKDASI